MKTRSKTYRFLRLLLRLIVGGILLYLLTLTFFYFKQERFFFNPKHLDQEFVYDFEQDFEELEIPVAEDVSLNALHFKADSAKGIILYLHGNGGAISDWGRRAPLFLDNGYDVLFVDYRGYGKSDGEYTTSEQLFSDMQKAYDFTKSMYSEDRIIVLGFSLGSGLAAYVASENAPKMLILNAPYYSWKTLVADEIAPPIPAYLIKYDIPTYRFIQEVDCPITIFYGTRDMLIRPATNAERLLELAPDRIDLIPIPDASHNGIHITKKYYDELKVVLGDV